MKLRKSTIAILLTLGISGGVWAAYPVTDATLISVVKTGFNAVAIQLSAFQTNMATMLTQIGSAINQNGSKVATTVEAAAKADREFQTENPDKKKLVTLKVNIRLPITYVANPHQGGLVQFHQVALPEKGHYGLGEEVHLMAPLIRLSINRH